MKKNLENDITIKNSVNIFAFMMKNRHKQDEALEEIKKIDNTTEEDNSNSDASVQTIQSKTKVKNSLFNAEMNTGNQVNAFQYLMCNRLKETNSEDEDNLSYDSSSSIKKKKYKKKNENKKLKTQRKRISSSSSEDSMDDCNEESNNVQILKSRSQREIPILISPSDSKSKLINVNEVFDLEETFRDEIKECFSKKKKKTKRGKKQKNKNNTDKPLQSTHTDNPLQSIHTDKPLQSIHTDKPLQSVQNDKIYISENEAHQIDKNQEIKNFKVNSSQPGIKIFFKPSANVDLKENSSINNKLSNDQNAQLSNIFNNEDDNLINSNSRSYSNSDSQTLEIKQKKLKNCNENVLLMKMKSYSMFSKEKTRSLRELRIEKSNIRRSDLNTAISSSSCDAQKNSSVDFRSNIDSSDLKNKTEEIFKNHVDGDCGTNDSDSEFKNGTNNNAVYKRSKKKVKNLNKHCAVTDNSLDSSNKINTENNIKMKCRKEKKFYSKNTSDKQSNKDDSDSDFKINKDKKTKSVISKDSISHNDTSENNEEKNTDSELQNRADDGGSKLRRSSRAVKKTKPFEIFDVSKENRIKNKKNNLKGNMDLDGTIKKVKKKKILRDKNGTERKKKFSSDTVTSLESGNNKKHLKKSRRTKENSNAVKQNNNESSDTDIIILDSPDSGKKTHQLASIFIKKKKITISPTKLKARKEFLFSDVPENLKKLSAKCTEEQNQICPFPKWSHIKQENDAELFWRLPEPNVTTLNKNQMTTSFRCDGEFKILPCRKTISHHSEEPLTSFPLLNPSTICHILAYLKNKIKTFPVMSVFNSFLKSKREHIQFYEKEYATELLKLQKDAVRGKLNNTLSDGKEERKKSKRKRKARFASKGKRRKLEDSLVECEEPGEETIWHEWVHYEWMQVFAPKSTEHIIGNLGPISKLKEFLTKWKSTLKSDNCVDRDSISNTSDDSCDTYSEKASVVNAMLITGPSGIGKTASVYAVAQDLGYKVLEINASSSRQGKELMSQLSEATQSHNVRTVGNNQAMLNSQATALQTNPLTQDSHPTDRGKSMSLILIEDIDIVFEEADEGFSSAVNTLLCTSKRPIIMTSSVDASFPIPKIKEEYDETEFCAPNPEHTAQYLQLLCLANGVFTSLKEIELLVKSNNSDIRKSILDLQLWILSGKCRVHWWKIDNEDNLSKALKCHKSNDISLLEIFPSASNMFCKSVEIPICLGSIWSKPDAVFLKNGDGLSNISLHWSLLAGNCDTFLPFYKKEKQRKLKYPLKKDDPALRRSSLWQKHSWLSLDDESDVEEHPKEASIENISENIPPISEPLKKCLDLCMKNLNNFLNSFADLDILSCQSHLSQDEYPQEFRRNWWTPSVVDGLESSKSNSLPHYDLNSNLISEVSNLNLSNVRNELFKVTQSVQISEELLPLCVEVAHGSSIIMSPHCRISIRKQKELEKLDHALSSELLSQNILNRSSMVTDYLPALRDIARSDHVGEAIQQQFKRNRRFLKHFNHLEINSLSKANLLDLCNLFQSSIE